MRWRWEADGSGANGGVEALRQGDDGGVGGGQEDDGARSPHGLPEAGRVRKEVSARTGVHLHALVQLGGLAEAGPREDLVAGHVALVRGPE